MMPNQLQTCAPQPQNGKTKITLLNNAPVIATVYTAGPNGSAIVSLIGAIRAFLFSNAIQVSISNGGNTVLGTISMPIGAGFVSGVPSVNLIDPTIVQGVAFDADGNPFLHLIAGDQLNVTMLFAQFFAGEFISIVAMGWDF